MHASKCESCIRLEQKTLFRYIQTQSEFFTQQKHTKLQKKEVWPIVTIRMGEKKRIGNSKDVANEECKRSGDLESGQVKI